MKKQAVVIELTGRQVEEIGLLGRILWPEANLALGELCRRILLDGADGMIVGEYPGSHRHEPLLERRSLPTAGTIWG